MSYLEICVHCYKYSKLLNLQLSSYVINGGEYLKDIKHVVYTCEEDESTNAVCDFFANMLNLEKRLLHMNTLAARGYGRDMAVKECESEWLWFADADHLISENSMKSLLETLQSTEFKFLFPQIAVKNRNDEDIDNYLKTIEVPDVINFDFEKLGMETARKKHRVASGGVQIVQTEYIKKIGYAYRHKQHSDWTSCRDDKRFRKLWYENFEDDPITAFVMEGHRHLTHKVKRRNDHSAEM